jgi:acetoin utilization deacetylase AcuC-like enzyme
VDTTFHPLYSSMSARVATGSLLNVVDQVVTGQVKNGFALIRPPGKKKSANCNITLIEFHIFFRMI